MKKISLSSTDLASLALAAIIVVFALFDARVFNLLSLDAAQTNEGQYWRILTANFVHFGWAHTLMNIAALIFCTLALLSEISLQKYLGLLLVCCLSVGLGIYWFNPEYKPYAGLSGAIHGLAVAGFLQTRVYPLWIKIAGLLLTMAKLVQENLPGYEPSYLQLLIPAGIAVESHVYGALAGAGFVLVDELLQQKKRKI